MIALREFGSCKRRVLFVLGHMRSGSSLLVHILNSNPEILGYGETHIGYHNRRSFINLEETIRQQFRNHGKKAARTRYIMDKILHRYIINASVLQDSAVRAIVLVRHPDRALPSIVSVTQEESPEKALSYYVERLQQLDNLIQHLERRVLFTTYEELVARSEETLRRIAQFLELRTGLSTEYETMWATGKEGIGDPSSAIEGGTIIRKDKKQSNVAIAQEKMQRAKSAYARFCGKHSIA